MKMKKVLALILILLLALSLTACGGGENSGNEIPDVFGLNYTDAIEILEDDGFEVKAIETSVDSISEKLLYPLEKVEKGSVFKIDDYVLDNLGNLNKDYDVFYDGELVSEDKSIIIYYAKEDYVLEEDVTSNSTTPSTESSKPSTTDKETATNSIDPDFKAAMDSYEKFMDEYVAFMKKYKANPSDLGLLADYADYMSKYADFVEDFEKWDDEDLNAAETAYYIDVQARVSKKLLEVAQ
jgi:hypothetical protein